MAKKDIRGSKILFDNGADGELICFHCQQAIEKYIKGYLIYKTGHLFEGHNLVKLCKSAALYNESFNALIKEMAFVNAFYIETRYPSVDPLIVSKEDVTLCLDIMDRVVKMIDKLIEIDRL